MEDQKTPPSIEQLNEQFIRDLEGDKKAKKGRPFKWLVIGLLWILVIWVGWRLRPENDREPPSSAAEPADENVFTSAELRVNESVFTGAELEKWVDTEADEMVVPLQYNQEIEVQNQRAFTRIVNPVYSTYPVGVKIISDDRIILYRSEKLAPGTILEAVTLNRELAEEETDAAIEYTVYDREDNIIGTYTVKVKLLQK